MRCDVSNCWAPPVVNGSFDQCISGLGDLSTKSVDEKKILALIIMKKKFWYVSAASQDKKKYKKIPKGNREKKIPRLFKDFFNIDFSETYQKNIPSKSEKINLFSSKFFFGGNCHSHFPPPPPSKKWNENWNDAPAMDQQTAHPPHPFYSKN